MLKGITNEIIKALSIFIICIKLFTLGEGGGISGKKKKGYEREKNSLFVSFGDKSNLC